MFSVLHPYKLRLTNLSQANRSLKLTRLSTRKDIDLTDLSQLNQLSATEILGKIIAGQNVTLIKQLSARSEAINLADRRLGKVWHEVNTIYEESGTYDLFLGYPFVEGRFLDGSIARCPVVLFPVRLIRNFQGGPRWVLQANPEEDLGFNTTFFLAYEKFMQVRLGQAFWEDGPQGHSDLQGFLNGLYKQMVDYNVTVHFNSELFQFRVDHFPEKTPAILEQLPIGKLRFLPHAVLGIFPQSDSALLQDYEVLEAHPTRFSWDGYSQGRNAKETVPYTKEDERYYVAAVDQSQEEALLRVKAGESVVVHGPPGTGKSQVILNLISDAMARGKKVLVCSQKRAALDVVFQRMSEVGLGRFAALVHDYRGDRNKIFARIRQQIEDIERFEEERGDLGLDIWLRDFRRDSRRIDDLGQSFEKLFAALTQRGRFGISAHELYVLAHRKSPYLDMDSIAGHFDLGTWQTCLERLANILDYAELFEPDHPWRHRLPLNRLGLGGKGALHARLRSLPTELDTLHQQWSAMGNAGRSITQHAQIPPLLEGFHHLETLLAQPGAKVDLASAVAGNLSPKLLREKLAKLGKLFQKMAEFKVLDGLPVQLYEDTHRHFSNYEAQRKRIGGLFSTRWLKGWWYVRQLLSRRGRKMKDADLKVLKGEIDVLSALVKLCMTLDEHPFFNDMPLAGSPSDLQAWQVQKLRNVDAVVAWKEVDLDAAFRPQITGGKFDESRWQEQLADARRLEALQASIAQFIHHLQSWFHAAQIAQLVQALANPGAAHDFSQKLTESFERDYDDLCQLDALLESLNGNQRLALEHLEKYICSHAKKDLLNQAQQGMLMAWLAMLEAAHPELMEPSSRHMPERLETYRHLVADRVKTVTGLIQRRLKDAILDRIEYNRLNNPVTYRDIAHQVRKQRQLWPVRKLVQQFWTQGLSTLVPCWMASPESVSAIFPMEEGYFDIVIFDEASQCYVERALPVLLRGRQCVVAGDDKQLPPFDLYNVKADEAEAPFVEDQMALEVESILDLARTSFRECKLSWHYRSSEKELINFSNFAFYEGRLNVLPPAKHEPISQPPISYIRVDGVWEQNVNRVEAQKVAALVEELILRPDNPTVGVVTFNYHQKELIRTLLEERLEQLRQIGDQATLRKLYEAMEREEGEERKGVFVKNIENVQGDERDIIIFSVGYARNPAGKLVAHFGLLNQRGGENRLNVAITRAKKKKIIVSSVEPEELKLEEAKYAGPKLLKRYLQYARAVSQQETATVATLLRQVSVVPDDAEMPQTVTTPTPIDYISALKAGLEKRGLNVVQAVSDGNFTLDLVVVGADGAYVLGIECEGRNYFLGRSAKEREVYRPGLLSARGWRLYRVWARNYFLNPEQEVERILAAVKEALENP